MVYGIWPNILHSVVITRKHQARKLKTSGFLKRSWDVVTRIFATARGSELSDSRT